MTAIPSSAESFSADAQRLLRTASRQPWGEGRELEATIHELYEALRAVESRLGTATEDPADLELARQTGHTLRAKLSLFQFYESRKLASEID